MRRGKLGVEYQNATNTFLEMVHARSPDADNAGHIKTHCDNGVVLQKISPLSPLAHDPFNAKPGDIICSFEAVIDGTRQYFDVDNEGDVRVPWYTKEGLPMPDVFHTVKKGDVITVHLWSVTRQVLISGDIVLPDMDEGAFKRLYPPWTGFIPYVAFAGLLVQPLSNNLKQSLKSKLGMLKYEEMHLPSLMVVSVFGNSAAKEAGVLKQGDRLEFVNGIAVKTLQDYKDALEKPVSGKFISFQTKENALLTLDAERVLNEEPLLAKQYAYPLLADLLGIMRTHLQRTAPAIVSDVSVH